MSLNSRLIAIQGIGFTPIALAVMGLIALIQEEERRNQVYGSGKRTGVPKSTPLPARQQESQADIERLVREKWDAIEEAYQKRFKPPAIEVAKPAPKEPKPQDNQMPGLVLNPAKPKESSREITHEIPSEVARKNAITQEKALLAGRRRQAEEEALMLMLAEL